MAASSSVTLGCHCCFRRHLGVWEYMERQKRSIQSTEAENGSFLFFSKIKGDLIEFFHIFYTFYCMFVYGIMLVPKVSLHINVHFNIVCTNHRFFRKVASHQHGGSRKRTQVSRGENKASGEQIEISDYLERAPLLFVSLYL